MKARKPIADLIIFELVKELNDTYDEIVWEVSPDQVLDIESIVVEYLGAE